GMGGLVLVTGATGFLGAQVARRLVSQTDHQVVALVRAPNGQAATRRLGRAWWDWPQRAGGDTDGGRARGGACGPRLPAGLTGGRVRPVPGQTGTPSRALDPPDWRALTRRVTHI